MRRTGKRRRRRRRRRKTRRRRSKRSRKRRRSNGRNMKVKCNEDIIHKGRMLPPNSMCCVLSLITAAIYKSHHAQLDKYLRWVLENAKLTDLSIRKGEVMAISHQVFSLYCLVHAISISSQYDLSSWRFPQAMSVSGVSEVGVQCVCVFHCPMADRSHNIYIFYFFDCFQWNLWSVGKYWCFVVCPPDWNRVVSK